MTEGEQMEKTIFPILPARLVVTLRLVVPAILAQVTEIRLRADQPVLLMLGNADSMLRLDGRLTKEKSQACFCTREDVAKTIQLVTRNSLYAFEQEIQSGFITINGGHRIGLAGQAILDSGQLKALKYISSLNLRIAREKKGIADMVFPYLVKSERNIASTLIISPPRCGKTTLLRDIIRLISSGSSCCHFTGAQVGVVDERSEIAACFNGIPTVELGPRVDVLDGCPKATGMLMLIRSMSPQVVVTDELGNAADAEAVREALCAGVSVIASVHGTDAADVERRPGIGELVRQKYFERYIILSDVPSIGTVDAIIDVRYGKPLVAKNGVKVCG